jgi:DNA-binding MarR family transcriptional regulator
MQLLHSQAMHRILRQHCCHSGGHHPSTSVGFVTASLDLGNYLPYLVNRLGAALVASMTADALAEHQLSIDMWRVLAVLSYRGAQRQIDLVTMTSVEASTMSRLVTRLVRTGLVTRRRSETSSREVVIELTGKGRALVSRLIPIAQRLEETASAGIPAKDMAVVKRTLRRMYENILDKAVEARLKPGPAVDRTARTDRKSLSADG